MWVPNCRNCKVEFPSTNNPFKIDYTFRTKPDSEGYTYPRCPICGSNNFGYTIKFNKPVDIIISY